MKRRKSENKKLLKIVSEFRPFDYGFLIAIEKQALIQMTNYFENYKITYSSDTILEDLKLALKLLDIITEEDSAWHPNEAWRGDGWIDKYVNIKNWKRFLPKAYKYDFSKPIFQDYLRREKAWHVYNKLKYYRMRTWWN